MRSHLNETSNTQIWSMFLPLYSGEAMLCGLPLFHANGTMITGAIPFSMNGHVVLLTPNGFRSKSVIKYFYKIVEHYKPVTFSAVPTVLSALLTTPIEDEDISSLRFVILWRGPPFRRFI